MNVQRSVQMLGRSGLVGVALLAAGCSQVPDAVNPVEWYRSASDALTGPDKPAAKTPPASTENRSIPGADKPVPNLSTVPERPQAPSARDRARLEEGLMGDRAQARHTSEDIRRQNEQPEPPRPATAAPAPAPAAPSQPARATVAPVAQPAPPPPPPPPSSQPSGPPPLPPGMGAAPASAPMTAPASAEPATVIVSSAGSQATPRRGAPAAPAVRPAPTQELASLDATMPRGLVKVATIYFVHGSSNLSDDERGILQYVAVLHRQTGGFVRIVGHASSRTISMDPIEHDRINLAMSAERAETIANELARSGVARDQIMIVARADRDPIFAEVMPSGEAGNRRAEIYLEGAGRR
ncbi:MAG: OmpA family protein [Rhodospirillales bacterium]|nr:OmpA family protein [Rhodospirillales bacterium]